MILDETRERFLIAIAKQVDPARIAEIHFFAPIRQGGVESGVAVIAAARNVEPGAAASPAESAVEASPVEESAVEASPVEASPIEASLVEESAVEESAVEESAVEESAVEESAVEESAVERSPADESPLDEGSVEAIDEASGADAGENPSLAASDSSEASTSPDESPEPPMDHAPQDDDRANVSAPIERHVIYTARYRLTLKGPDRGKWETNVTAEADAPIITVDAVVRGVQRRAGDVDDPTRMNGDEVRAALPGV